MEEINARPLSWLSKEEQMPPAQLEEVVSKSQNFGLEQLSLEEQEESKAQDVLDLSSKQSAGVPHLPNPNNVTQKLEVIGEASIEMGSSLAN